MRFHLDTLEKGLGPKTEIDSRSGKSNLAQLSVDLRELVGTSKSFTILWRLQGYLEV